MDGQHPSAETDKRPGKPRRHCNHLDGKKWLQNSISVWSDIRKTPEENRLNHPALFPQMLVERLIETFLPVGGSTILDPFAGSGSTVLAAHRLGKRGIGLELSPEYAALALGRLAAAGLSPDESASGAAGDGTGSRVHQASAVDLLKYVAPNSIDLCITSPPYWNILNQRRTADYKQVRHYGNLTGDFGAIDDYDDFLDAVASVLADVFIALRPGAYGCLIVMDLRKKDRFFPLHSDLAARASRLGFIYDDLIIWNRQSEYNNLRPLGYPSVFRVNKIHEFVLLLKKPREKRDGRKRGR